MHRSRRYWPHFPSPRRSRARSSAARAGAGGSSAPSSGMSRATSPPVRTAIPANWPRPTSPRSAGRTTPGAGSARTDPVMPLRIKLTLAFTGVMAVLLTGAGIALTLLVAANLDSTIDDGLAARAGDAAAVVDKGKLAATGEPFAQVLSPQGTVSDTTTGAGTNPLLGPN